jgi:nucleoside-diphosphate-sugar epimerase
MNRILVTGASGFIGKHLIPRLRGIGHEVIENNSQSGDVWKEATWSRIPRADVVVHLAGKTFVPDSWRDPGAFVKCNLLGTVAALNYCRMHKARMIFLSSYLYGNPQSLPIPETAPLVANNPYALSKKLAEEACRFYAHSFDIEIAILRPFNVYGPGQSEDFLIPCIIRQVVDGKEIKVRSLTPKRDYVHVSDLVEAIIKCVAVKQRLSIFNIGTGKSHSVGELIQIIQGIKKTNLTVISSGEERQDEIMDTVADVSLARSALGWQPRWSLGRGISSLLGERPGKAGIEGLTAPSF